MSALAVPAPAGGLKNLLCMKKHEEAGQSYKERLPAPGCYPVPGLGAPGQGANGFFGFISPATSG
jgi:hypothetical protein